MSQAEAELGVGADSVRFEIVGRVYCGFIVVFVLVLFVKALDIEGWV